MKIFKKMKKGFTLVELVVVIAVIAILAAVSVGAYFGVTESANNSRLEQEAKQAYTAIQTVALAPNDHSSLSKTGLTITDVDGFKGALEENLGHDIFLTFEDDYSINSMPTLYFSTETYTNQQYGSSTVYHTFEYYSHEIGNKKAVGDVTTGKLHVSSSNAIIEETPVEVSIAEAINLANEQDGDDKYTTTKYIIEGTIDNIENDSYGNFTITDGTNSLYVYGLNDTEGNRYSAMEVKPVAGDFIKIKGTLGKHGGEPQMYQAILLEHNKNTTKPDPITLSTILEAVNIGNSCEEDQNTGVQEYIIQGEVLSVTNFTYGNMIISDGTAEILIYGLYQNGISYKDLDLKPNEGDIVIVQGVLGNFNGEPQMKNGNLLSFDENSPVETPEENTVVFNLTDINDRKEYSTTIQVWEKDFGEERILTIKNNKNTSSTDVKDTCPPRFYVGSDLQIVFTKNIVELEIEVEPSAGEDGDLYEYDGDLFNLASTDFTVSQNEDKITITLITPCTAFEIESFSEQLRPETIKVKYNNEALVNPPHEHNFVNGECECGESDPNYQPPGNPDEYTEGWYLVRDINELEDGDQIVIAAKDANFAISTLQNSNNRGQAEITKNGDEVILSNDVQLITLEQHDSKYAFETSAGYLYAASSSSNYLKTQATLDENGKWSIEIVEDTGVATIKAQGTNTKNWLRYNSNSSLFSCYSSGQGDIVVYKNYGEDVTQTLPTFSSIELKNDETYSLTTLGQEIDLPELNKVYSNGQKESLDNSLLNWASSNTQLVSVNNGKIKAEAEGNETIIITGTLIEDNTKTVSFNVIINTSSSSGGSGTPDGELTQKEGTLTFDGNKNNRTSFSTTKQVWEQNGITFTNEKGSSSNNIGNYGAPVRLYQNSKIKVSVVGKIKTIVFDCNSSTYATELKNSIGASATVSSDKVTVNLSDVPEFVVEKLTAQVRIDSLTVTYLG